MKRIDDATIIEEGINEAAKQQDFLQMQIQKMSVEWYREADGEEKQDRIIRHLMETGEIPRKGFISLIGNLRDFEKLLYATNKFYRDHIFHTFRVWGLGLYLYYNGLREFIDEKERSHFHYTWYLASVYHDIGYPVKGLKDLSERLRNFFGNLELRYSANFEETINPLLNDSLFKDELKEILPNEQNDIDHKVLERRHGLTGALLLLRSLKERFDRHGDLWSKKDIYPALRAIGVHDGYRPISFNTEPFSALLVICDELQEWGRPYLSPHLEKYITTDHIELGLETAGATPSIEARIDYTKFQSELKRILKWDGKRAEEDKKDNFGRLKGIKVNVKMEY